MVRARGDAKFLQAVAVDPRTPPDGHDQCIEWQLHDFAIDGAAQRFAVAAGPRPPAPCAQPQIHAIFQQACFDEVRHILVLARQQPPAYFHLGHPRTQPGKCLGQLAADRPTAQHQQTGGPLAQLPQGFAR